MREKIKQEKNILSEHKGSLPHVAYSSVTTTVNLLEFATVSHIHFCHRVNVSII